MIHLINDYYLDADNNCYTVGIPKKNKDEKFYIEENMMSEPRRALLMLTAVSSKARRKPSSV